MTVMSKVTILSKGSPILLRSKIICTFRKYFSKTKELNMIHFRNKIISNHIILRF